MNLHKYPPLFRSTAALCISSLLVFANLYTTQPLLPLFVETFALSELQAAKSLTLATLMLGLSLLVYGPLSDAIGRKAIMIASLIASTAITLALSYTQSFEQVLWLRAAHGFALGGIPATAIAYIGEEYPRAKIATTVGLYISFNSLGGITGRVMGGVISDWWEWQTVFACLTACNIATLLLLSWLLPCLLYTSPSPRDRG